MSQPTDNPGLQAYLTCMADGRFMLAYLEPVIEKVQLPGVDARDVFHQPGDPLGGLIRLCRPGLMAASNGAVHDMRPFDIRRITIRIDEIQGV